jgi:hypothetical protein
MKISNFIGLSSIGFLFLFTILSIDASEYSSNSDILSTLRVLDFTGTEEEVSVTINVHKEQTDTAVELRLTGPYSTYSCDSNGALNLNSNRTCLRYRDPQTRENKIMALAENNNNILWSGEILTNWSTRGNSFFEALVTGRLSTTSANTRVHWRGSEVRIELPEDYLSSSRRELGLGENATPTEIASEIQRRITILGGNSLSTNYHSFVSDRLPQIASQFNLPENSTFTQIEAEIIRRIREAGLPQGSGLLELTLLDYAKHSCKAVGRNIGTNACPRKINNFEASGILNCVGNENSSKSEISRCINSLFIERSVEEVPMMMECKEEFLDMLVNTQNRNDVVVNCNFNSYNLNFEPPVRICPVGQRMESTQGPTGLIENIYFTQEESNICPASENRCHRMEENQISIIGQTPYCGREIPESSNPNSREINSRVNDGSRNDIIPVEQNNPNQAPDGSSITE